MRRIARTIALFVLAFGQPLLAHGDLHERIATLTERIRRDSRNAALLVRRAELRRLHREYRAAFRDLAAAERLDPSLAVVDLCRGALLLDEGRPDRARKLLERFLSRRPESGQGW